MEGRQAGDGRTRLPGKNESPSTSTTIKLRGLMRRNRQKNSQISSLVVAVDIRNIIRSNAL